GGAASVPELREKVCSLSDAFPACHMFVGVETGRMIVAARGRRDRCRFRDDQPAVRCTLSIILELRVARNAGPRLSPQAAHRRHDNAMLKRNLPDLHGCKEFHLNVCAHQDSLFVRGLRWKREVKETRVPHAQARDASLVSDVDLTAGDHCLPAMTPPSTGRMTPVMKLA